MAKDGPGMEKEGTNLELRPSEKRPYDVLGQFSSKLGDHEKPPLKISSPVQSRKSGVINIS